MREFVPESSTEQDAAEAPSSVHFPSGNIIVALNALAESHALACNAACSIWDFAVELSELNQLRVSRNALRWLLNRQLASHAYETTPRNAAQRTFFATSAVSIRRRSCFVITQEGHSLLLKAESSARGAGVPVLTQGASPFRHRRMRKGSGQWTMPQYDATRAELIVDGEVVKRFRRVARNQQTVLQAFEELQWTARIDDPLPPSGEVSVRRRLSETIRALNSHQLTSVVRFQGDGTGEGVRWEYVG